MARSRDTNPLAELKASPDHPVYLFLGDEEVLKEEALEVLRKARGGGELRRFTAPDVRTEAILEARQNGSLFEPVAVLVVRNASRLPDADAETLAEVLGGSEHPPVVFWDATVDRRKRGFARLAKAGKVLEFRQGRPWEVVRRLPQEAGRLGVTLANGVPELLVDLLGTNLLRLRGTIEQLATAVGPGGTIDIDEVAEQVPEARAHALWELQAAIERRDGAGAIRLFRQAVAEGQSVYALVGGLAACLRRIRLLLDPAAAKAPAGELARRLGVPPFRVDALRPAANRFRGRHLEEALGRLSAIDLQIKTGGVEGEAALEEWLRYVCGGPSPSPGRKASAPRSSRSKT